MFKRRRLKKVIVHLTNYHGRPDRTKEIILQEGEKFHHDIGCLRITKSGHTVRVYEFCAGYDTILEYIYGLR